MTVMVKDSNSLEEGSVVIIGKKVKDKERSIKLSKYAPIFKWLPKYTRYQAVCDAIAGFSLGLTMIPQSLAYAALSGQSAQVFY